MKELTTLAKTIRDGATDQYAISMAHLLEKSPVILKDQRLSKINFSAYGSFEECIMHILLRGSVIQRSALLENTEGKHDLSMPALNKIGHGPAVGLICAYVRQTCQIMGCEFSGDVEFWASGVLDTSGYLTVMEWARFFQNISKGVYANQYEKVNTRGLNPEFLNRWLEVFCEGRESTERSLRREIEPVTETGTQILYDIRKGQEEYFKLMRDVHDKRTEIENGLVSRYTQCKLQIKNDKGQIELVDIEQSEITGDNINAVYQVPIEADLPKAPYIRLFDFLQTFYCTAGQDPKEVIESLTAQWELERVLEFPDIEAKDVYRAKAKSLLLTLKKELGLSMDFLMQGIEFVAEKHPLMEGFWEAATGEKYVGDKPYLAVAGRLDEFARNLIQAMRQGYKADAMARLEAGAYPIYINEYISLCCIRWSIAAGLSHPFDKILNIEQQ